MNLNQNFMKLSFKKYLPFFASLRLSVMGISRVMKPVCIKVWRYEGSVVVDILAALAISLILVFPVAIARVTFLYSDAFVNSISNNIVISWIKKLFGSDTSISSQSQNDCSGSILSR